MGNRIIDDEAAAAYGVEDGLYASMQSGQEEIGTRGEMSERKACPENCRAMHSRHIRKLWGFRGEPNIRPGKSRLGSGRESSVT